MNKYKIYLDDIRTPLDGDWTIVRSYDEFVKKINSIGLENIEMISLDHDLDESAMKEWRYGVVKNYKINYNNIIEKTGYDCAIWLVNQWLNGGKVVKVVTHSANAIGSANIIGYINNYLHLNRMVQDCIRVEIAHKI